MTDWKPIESAPYQKEILVRNPQMHESELATRGYVTELGVHPNQSYCTGLGWSGSRLICATEWRLPDPPEEER